MFGSQVWFVSLGSGARVKHPGFLFGKTAVEPMMHDTLKWASKTV